MADERVEFFPKVRAIVPQGNVIVLYNFGKIETEENEECYSWRNKKEKGVYLFCSLNPPYLKIKIIFQN